MWTSGTSLKLPKTMQHLEAQLRMPTGRENPKPLEPILQRSLLWLSQQPKDDVGKQSVVCSVENCNSTRKFDLENYGTEPWSWTGQD